MSTVSAPEPPTEASLSKTKPHPTRVRSWWVRAAITLILCAAVFAGGGGIFNWLTSFKQEPPRQEDIGLTKTYSVSVFRVEPVDLQRVITAFGTALADREVLVAAEVAGQIVEANQLEIGRSVLPAGVGRSAEETTVNTPGDLLVRIDPQTYEERVLQARKLLAQDDVELQRLAQEHENNKRLLMTEQANVETSTTEYKNAVDLQREGVGTESAVRRAQLELRRYEDALARLQNELDLFDVRRQAIVARKDAHQSDLELSLLDKNRTQIMPPFAGVISEVHVERGQYVRPGDPLIRLTDPSRVEVPLSLTLSDFLAIAAMRESGRQLRVALAENETAAARWFSDPLDELRQAPEADERTRTVRVYTEIDNTAQEVPLLPGTFVHARLPGPIIPAAIAIPRDAVVEGTVFVAVPEEPSEAPSVRTPSTRSDPDVTTWFAHVERRTVRAGRTLQSLVLIDEGLSSGEWVVTTNLDVVHAGARLKISRQEGERKLTDELQALRTPQVQIVDAQADNQ